MLKKPDLTTRLCITNQLWSKYIFYGGQEKSIYLVFFGGGGNYKELGSALEIKKFGNFFLLFFPDVFARKKINHKVVYFVSQDDKVLLVGEADYGFNVISWKDVA